MRTREHWWYKRPFHNSNPVRLQVLCNLASCQSRETGLAAWVETERLQVRERADLRPQTHPLGLKVELSLANGKQALRYFGSKGVAKLSVAYNFILCSPSTLLPIRDSGIIQ